METEIVDLLKTKHWAILSNLDTLWTTITFVEKFSPSHAKLVSEKNSLIFIKLKSKCLLEDSEQVWFLWPLQWPHWGYLYEWLVVWLWITFISIYHSKNMGPIKPVIFCDPRRITLYFWFPNTITHTASVCHLRGSV